MMDYQKEKAEIRKTTIDYIEDLIWSHVDYWLNGNSIEIVGVEDAAKEIYDDVFDSYVDSEINNIIQVTEERLKYIQDFYVNWPGYY